MRNLNIAAVFAAQFVLAFAVHAQQYNIQEVGGTPMTFGPTVNDLGQVVFIGENASGDNALLRWQGGITTQLATIGTPVQTVHGSSSLSALGNPPVVSLDDSGNAIFLGSLNGNSGSQMFWDAATSTVRNLNGYGDYGGFSNAPTPALNNVRQYVEPEVSRITRHNVDDVGQQLIATTGTEFASLGGPFSNGPPNVAINDDGYVVFRGNKREQTGNRDGLYSGTRDNRIVVADRATDGFFNFGNFISINDGGDVVFLGQKDGVYSLWQASVHERNIMMIADGETYENPEAFSINDNGDIVFRYGGADAQISVYREGSIYDVVMEGDTLSDGEITALQVYQESMNNHGQFAFIAILDVDGDGTGDRSAIFLASPVPEPSSALLGVGVLSMLFLRRNRKS